MGDSIVSHIRCGQCGRELQENEQPCPACGSGVRAYSVELVVGEVHALVSIGFKHRDALGFVKMQAVVREKISRFTKRLAREVLRFDRATPDVTRKFHHVEERDANGKWNTVHNEEKEFPSKCRRP